MTTALIPSPTVEVLERAGVPKGETTGTLGRIMVMLAQRYGLDPALRHLEVIQAKGGGLQVYITADGWRVLAARSGEFDGLTFPVVEQGEHGWRVLAYAWRKGCEHPFEARAGAGFREGTRTIEDPEALAMTRATRRALRTAFSDQLLLVADEALHVAVDDAGDTSGEGSPRQVEQPPARPLDAGGAASPPPNRSRQGEAHHRVMSVWTTKARGDFLARFDITDTTGPWPAEAVAFVLDGGGAQPAQAPAAAAVEHGVSGE